MNKKIWLWLIVIIFFSQIVLSVNTDKLFLYYNFSSNANDLMGVMNMGISGATQVPGINNNAYYLDGINDRLTAPGKHVFQDGRNFSVNLWYKGIESRSVGVKYYPLISRNNSLSPYAVMTMKGGKPVYVHFDGGAWREWPISPAAINGDVWTMVTFINYANTTMSLYINGTEVANNPSTMQVGHGWEFDGVGWNGDDGGLFLNGTVDEIALWNKSIVKSDVSDLWNGGSGLFYPFVAGPGSTVNFSITAQDEWNSTAIIVFNATVNGTTYQSNASGVIETTILANNTNLFNITIASANYFNRSYISYNSSLSGDLIAELHQSEICFNASQKVNETSVTADSFTIDGTSHIACFNLSANTYNVQATKTGWYNQNQTFIVTALQNATLTIQNLSYANLTIYAIDGTTNESLSGYSLRIGSPTSPAFTENVTSVTNYSFYLINSTYNVTINIPGYAITESKANITVDGHTNFTFTLYKTNSVSITIRDEITNNLITENVTIRWSDNSTTWENTTDTGHLFVHNITATNYTLLFYSTNYSTRTYSISVGPSSHQYLTAYMISSTYSTIFTIKDIDTGTILDGVSITMYKLINSTWTTVESKYNDISGKAQFYYDPIANYRFYLSRTAYEDYIFYLNPILFSTYDVYMTRESVLNYSVDFDGISFIYSPTIFNNNDNTTLNFLISSPNGLLVNYGIAVYYPGGNDSASGVNAIGEQLSVDVNITNATAFDYVILIFNYSTSLAGNRTYTFHLPIQTNITGGTWITLKDKTYGLGIFERMLIATIIIIFVVGIATMVGQSLPGIALGLFLYGFLVFIGFIPLWAILPSMLVGVFFLIWKSGGY